MALLMGAMLPLLHLVVQHLAGKLRPPLAAHLQMGISSEQATRRAVAAVEAVTGVSAANIETSALLRPRRQHSSSATANSATKAVSSPGVLPWEVNVRSSRIGASIHVNQAGEVLSMSVVRGQRTLLDGHNPSLDQLVDELRETGFPFPPDSTAAVVDHEGYSPTSHIQVRITSRTHPSDRGYVWFDQNGDISQISFGEKAESILPQLNILQKVSLACMPLFVLAGLMSLILQPGAWNLKYGVGAVVLLTLGYWMLELDTYSTTRHEALGTLSEVPNRWQHIRQATSGWLFLAIFTFLAGFTAGPLLDRTGWTSISLLEQVFGGAVVGLAVMSSTLLALSAMRRAQIVTISPSLPSWAIRSAGFNARQGVGMALQAATGEEIVYRWLGLSVLYEVTDNLSLAVALTTLTWIFTHPLGEFTPRRYRIGELAIYGVTFSALTILVGPWAAVAAHFAQNVAVLLAPLHDACTASQHDGVVIGEH